MTDRTAIEEFTLSELDSFYQLHDLFSKSIIFVHYNSKHQLYTDIDTFKGLSFRAYVYHMKESHSSTISLGQKNMKLILFLSKALANAETHY